MRIDELFLINPVHLDKQPQTWLNKLKCTMTLESGMVMCRTKHGCLAVPLTNIACMKIDPEDPRAKGPEQKPQGAK